MSWLIRANPDVAKPQYQLHNPVIAAFAVVPWSDAFTVSDATPHRQLHFRLFRLQAA